MVISDSDPERRNLMLASLAFIIYYTAGGALSEDTLRLPMVSIEFSRPFVVGIFAWAMLLWFAVRYWQTHKRAYAQAFQKEASSLGRHPMIIAYAARRLEKPHNVIGGFETHQLRTVGRWNVEVADIVSVKEDGDPGQFNEENQRHIRVDGFRGAVIRLFFRAKLSLQEPAFGAYVVPYLLFVFAVVVSLASELLKCAF